MASYNKIIIVGNLGKDPETRYMPDGNAVTNLSIATSETWKDKASGEKKEHTEWWRVTCFGRLAEVAGEYLKKGSPVLIEGRGRTNKWQDKDGNDRYTFQVIADQLRMLGKKEGGAEEGEAAPAAQPKGGTNTESKPAAAKKPAGKFDDMEDDIPF